MLPTVSRGGNLDEIKFKKHPFSKLFRALDVVERGYLPPLLYLKGVMLVVKYSGYFLGTQQANP